MKYYCLLFITALLVSTISARGHYYAPMDNGSTTDQTLRSINMKVESILSMIREGFSKLEINTDQILEYLSPKISVMKNGSEENYGDSDYSNSSDSSPYPYWNSSEPSSWNSRDSSSFWNFSDSSSGNYSFNIYDEIEFEACRNGSSNAGPFHTFILQGPAGEDQLRDFEGIHESEQPMLNAVHLSLLNIRFDILLKSLQFCCNLEELILQEVNLSFPNGNLPNEESEIYLPNLKKYYIRFSRSRPSPINLTNLLPFKKEGSKYNTDITVTSLPRSSKTFRVVPSQGRIESHYYTIDEEILSKLEPGFDLKELIVEGGGSSNDEMLLQIEYIPVSLRLLKLAYINQARTGQSVLDILHKCRLLNHLSYSSTPYGKIQNFNLKLQDLPQENLESLSLRTIPLEYTPQITFPKLERLDLDGNIVHDSILRNLSSIFPSLKKLILDTEDSDLVERVLDLPGLNQVVVRGSNLRGFRACHKDHWCNIYKGISGNWIGADVTVDGNFLDQLTDSIFPEFKGFSFP